MHGRQARREYDGLHTPKHGVAIVLPLLMVLATPVMLIGGLSRYCVVQWLDSLDSGSSFTNTDTANTILLLARSLPIILVPGLSIPLGGKGDVKGNKPLLKASVWLSVLAMLPPTLMAVLPTWVPAVAPSALPDWATLCVLGFSLLLSCIALAVALPNSIGYLWRFTGPSARLGAILLLVILLPVLALSPSVLSDNLVNNWDTLPSSMSTDHSFLWPLAVTFPIAILISPLCMCAVAAVPEAPQPGAKRGVADTVAGFGWIIVALGPTAAWVVYTYAPEGVLHMVPWMFGCVVAGLGLLLVICSMPRRCKAPLQKKVEDYPSAARYMFVGVVLGVCGGVASLVGLTAAQARYAGTDALSAYSPFGLSLVPVILASAICLVLVPFSSCLTYAAVQSQVITFLAILTAVAIGGFWVPLTEAVTQPLVLVAVCALPAGCLMAVSVLVMHRLTVSLPAGHSGPSRRPWTSRSTLTAANFLVSFSVPFVMLSLFDDGYAFFSSSLFGWSDADIEVYCGYAFMGLCVLCIIVIILLGTLSATFDDGAHALVPLYQLRMLQMEAGVAGPNRSPRTRSPVARRDTRVAVNPVGEPVPAGEGVVVSPVNVPDSVPFAAMNAGAGAAAVAEGPALSPEDVSSVSVTSQAELLARSGTTVGPKVQPTPLVRRADSEREREREGVNTSPVARHATSNGAITFAQPPPLRTSTSSRYGYDSLNGSGSMSRNLTGGMFNTVRGHELSGLSGVTQINEDSGSD
ncbi:hypothetical protein KIPB_001408 [Kipferlia bialata]|uniref:Uncharacterized protein n=1 Tax=Kipferlia bialata TaxID=797122 RepID=A0A9K3CNP1_9EUKA|nr:hypothetical protein KIPB_001408 [Kipferlia bialata]|eukprot:g1408.t1